jgi:hypothetical protein
MADRWYSNRTQIAWTCYALAMGRTISTVDEIGEVSGWRLGAIVHTLRTRYNWPILTDYRGPDRIGHYRLANTCDVLMLDYPRSAKDVRAEIKANGRGADDERQGVAGG